MAVLTYRCLMAIAFCLWICVFHNVSSNAIGKRPLFRTKRSEDNQNCIENRNQCRSNATCKRALRNVMKKCAESNGRCEAEIDEIDNCVVDLETVRLVAFSNKSDRICSCSRHEFSTTAKLSNCFNIFNVVHRNPCYDKGLKLRKLRNQLATSTISHTSSFVTESVLTPGQLHMLEAAGKQTEADTTTAGVARTTYVKFSHKQHISSSQMSTQKETVNSSGHQLSCSGKLLITGGVFLFVILTMSFGVFIYCKRKRHSGYVKAAGMKKTPIYSLITFKKNKNNKATDDNKE